MANRSESTDVPTEGAAVAPRRLEYMRLAEIIPAERNAKAHDTAELRDAVTTLGFINPGLWDERTGRLIAGHGRLELLSALEATPGVLDDIPEGLMIDESGAWLMPIVRGWSSRDDAEADRAALALNKVGEGRWHKPVLDKMITELAGSPIGLTGTGFNTGALMRKLTKAPSLRPQASEARPMKWKWFLVRVPAHRVADVAPLIAEIGDIDEVDYYEADNAGGRLEGRKRSKDAEPAEDEVDG